MMGLSLTTLMFDVKAPKSTEFGKIMQSNGHNATQSFKVTKLVGHVTSCK